MRLPLAMLVGALALGAAGCDAIKAIAYYLRPAAIDPAEYEFPEKARVLVMLDPARPGYDNPVFSKALYDRMVEIFREKNSTAELIAPREVAVLKRDNPDFRNWSIRRIGSELKATHVLYGRVDFLQSRQSPDYPVLEPRVSMRLKVIAVERPDGDARVWPTEREGREVTCERQAQEASDPSFEDAAMTKLGRDTAYLVALPFFKHDQEEKRPREQ